MAHLSLSDAELKKSLQDFGVSCGPLTNTTRGVYAKKLSKLMAASSEEPEVVQARETISNEDDFTAIESTTSTRNSQRILKVLSVDNVDTSSSNRDVFSTPRSYTPDGSNLTRRPLSTPHRSSSRLERTQSTKSTTILTTTKAKTSNNPKEKSKSSGIFSFCRYLIPVLVVLVLLLMLVYYHMEEGAFKELTGKF